MTNAENPVVEEEVCQAVDEPQAEEIVQQKAEPPKEDPNQVNWRETRQTLKEQKRMIQELQDRLSAQTAIKAPVQEDEYADLRGLAKDDLLTMHQAERLAEMKARKIVQEALSKKDPAEVEERMRMKYSDFDEVLTEENVEHLMKTEPTLVKSIRSISDPVQQAEAAYRLAKRLCPQKNAEAEENMKKIDENQKKPLSSSAVKKSSALDQAHSYTRDRVLTKEGRDHYYQEMQEARKLGR